MEVTSCVSPRPRICSGDEPSVPRDARERDMRPKWPRVRLVIYGHQFGPQDHQLLAGDTIDPQETRMSERRAVPQMCEGQQQVTEGADRRAQFFDRAGNMGLFPWRNEREVDIGVWDKASAAAVARAR